MDLIFVDLFAFLQADDLLHISWHERNGAAVDPTPVTDEVVFPHDQCRLSEVGFIHQQALLSASIRLLRAWEATS
jgi:hypothetical protein